MGHQTMDVRRGIELVIETPEGLIVMRRLRCGKFEFELPGAMQVHRGRERALSRSRFVSEQDGKLVPRYDLLQPVVKDGELVGVKAPPVFRLRAAQ